jgi:hypothetical protein
MFSPVKIALVFIIISVVSGGFLAYRRSLINEGWDRALQKVEQKNEEARKAAGEAQRGVDACYDGGGLWDTLTGECSR